MIDHTLLKPQATDADIRRLCQEARQYQFVAVCVNPYWVPLAAAELAGSAVRVATVAGFPLGANTTEIKVKEAETAIAAGAHEVDMVLNIGELCGGNIDAVHHDIAAVVAASHSRGALVKVIFETALLNDEQKTAACHLSKDAGADFVKTSTGFSTKGANSELRARRLWHTPMDWIRQKRPPAQSRSSRARPGSRLVHPLRHPQLRPV